jgi:hypothetical protein
LSDSEPSSNVLFLRLSSANINEDQVLVLRSLCNQLAANPMLVTHCEIQHGATFFHANFSSDDPVPLWISIWKQFFCHERHGEWLRSISSCVLWQGEDPFLDYVWVYRTYEPAEDQLDGLANRIQCENCKRHFWIGNACRPWNCPYCKLQLVFPKPEGLDLP